MEDDIIAGYPAQRWGRGFLGFRSGHSQETTRQVVLIDDRAYWTTPAFAYLVASMGKAKQKVFLARNWRKCRPVVPMEGKPNHYRFKSGTHDV